MLTMTDEWTSPPPASPLNGTERFKGLNATVQDMWAFCMSDLKMNNVRGYLAEFLVSEAVGAAGKRIEWDAYDVLSPSGVKIEVKSSAYVQAWDQRRPSRIVFTGLTGRTWSPQDGESAEATYNADVFVFCVQTAQTHEAYDPLDVGQWDFYVLSRDAVVATTYRSLSLPTLLKLTGGPIPYGDLAGAIEAARI